MSYYVNVESYFLIYIQSKFIILILKIEQNMSNNNYIDELLKLLAMFAFIGVLLLAFKCQTIFALDMTTSYEVSVRIVIYIVTAAILVFNTQSYWVYNTIFNCCSICILLARANSWLQGHSNYPRCSVLFLRSWSKFRATHRDHILFCLMGI